MAKPTKLNETQARIILAMAQNGLKVQPAAQALHYSRTGADYHVHRIRELTGKDPRDFYDMCDLLVIAKDVLEKKEAAHD